MRLRHKFRVGVRSCELFIDVNTGFMKATWDPGMPHNMRPDELDQYRKGRDELLAKVAEIKGGDVLIVET